ncbi:MAG: hypothetical protein LBQ69_04555, partial [Treponema sp.]|nr:hypothetical protein [Treponema sp.]
MRNEEWEMGNRGECMVDLASRIVHCDSCCVVVNKIAGEATEGAGPGMGDLPRLLAAERAAPHWSPVRGDA